MKCNALCRKGSLGAPGDCGTEVMNLLCKQGYPRSHPNEAKHCVWSACESVSVHIALMLFGGLVVEGMKTPPRAVPFSLRVEKVVQGKRSFLLEMMDQ